MRTNVPAWRAVFSLLFILGSGFLSAGCGSDTGHTLAIPDSPTNHNSADTAVVETPGGPAAAGCVYAVENGATVSSDTAVPCGHTVPKQTGGDAHGDNGIPDGWQVYSQHTDFDGISYFVSKFVVPPAPTDVTGQLLVYYFPSLTPSNNGQILQPVLQYGVSPAGGGDFWAISSWLVDSSNNSFHSPLVQVNPGESILGAMHGIPPCQGGHCTSWEVSATVLGDPTRLTTLNTDGENANYVNVQAGVLEAYHVPSCAGFPTGGVPFTTLILEDSTGNLVTPTWNPMGSASCLFGSFNWNGVIEIGTFNDLLTFEAQHPDTNQGP
jgi:hypothetical protein